MAESRQSWPAVGSNVRANDVNAAIAKWGRLVTVCYEVETQGEHRGRAVGCWVGKYQVGTVESGREDEYRRFIESMAAEGLQATSRARFDRSTTSPRLWMVGEPERRPADAPFLPPLTEADVELHDEEAIHLDGLFQSKGKRRTAQRVGQLTNADGRTWLWLDGVLIGVLVGTQRAYVDHVLGAGLPATCSATIKRRSGRPLAVSVDVPDEREFGPNIALTLAAQGR
jgi:hypothetical protein